MKRKAKAIMMVALACCAVLSVNMTQVSAKPTEGIKVISAGVNFSNKTTMVVTISKDNICVIDLSKMSGAVKVMSVYANVNRNCILTVEGASKKNTLLSKGTATIQIPKGFVDDYDKTGISIAKLRDYNPEIQFTATLTDSLSTTKKIEIAVTVITKK